MNIRWKSCVQLTVEFMPGTDIEDACDELVTLSQRLQIHVDGDFNGVKLLAAPDTDRRRLAENYRLELEHGRGIKMASARV